MNTSLKLLVCYAVVVAGCATGNRSLPEFTSLPSQPGLRDPLVMLNGDRIATREQWEQQRRPELKAIFQHYMDGQIPKPVAMKTTVKGVHRDFLDGKATLKIISLEAGNGGPSIDLMLVVPNNRPGPAPVFLAMNFCGNHALTADARVPLTRGWLYDSCKGCSNNVATEAARGGQAQDWPLARLVERGYALASFCTTDIDSDRKEISDGIYAWLAGSDAAKNNPTNRGSIAAWAWGYHRCVDYLVSDRDVDAKRIAAVGHSRNGKTALLAAAYDERIALSIPHQAGCGGTAPSRGSASARALQANGRPYSETTAVINKAFPHWFNAEFKKFNNAPEKLPFDQHELVALMAPRPVLLSNATGDQWADPSGQFTVLKAAEPVYRLLKAGGCDATVMPPEGQLVASKLGYYIRPGKHAMLAADWLVFMQFADQQFSLKK